MTLRQEETVKRIKKYIEENDLYKNDDNYEFKEFSVEELKHGLVAVYSVTGLKNDEGTLAATFARNRRQIFIGKRGGLSGYKWDDKKKKDIDLKGWSDVMIYGYRH